MIYHHTSTLRTNLIWMTGVIEVEGKSEGAIHPQLGAVSPVDATLRRALKDFPPVAWFTTRIEIPRVLTGIEMVFVDKKTNEVVDRKYPIDADIANGMALNRVALGFPLDRVAVVRWPE
jgi:hypothetical protein